jgi:LacI family transcriptional regulator
VRKTTIKDVALRAGVNPSTVSRALNDSPEISDELKQKIKTIADQIGYKTNLMAKNLRLRRSSVIALIIPEMVAYFIPSVLQGITKLLNQHEYKLILLLTKDLQQLEEQHIDFSINAGVDGILISLSKQTNNLQHLLKAKEANVPVVIFDRILPTTDFDTLTIDDFIEAKDCAIKIIENNCKHVVAVYGNEKIDNIKKRKAGFESVMLKQTGAVKYTAIHSDDIKSAAFNLKNYLQKNIDVDAIFANSDETLIGTHLCLELLENKYKLNPFLVAISDNKFPEYLDRKILFLNHDGETLGYQAAEMLINKIFKKGQDNISEVIDIHFKLSNYLFDIR